MATGVSGQDSASPTQEGSYQSPGASQDDGIDHMLAQYSRLVERREGEGEDGGGEADLHRSRGREASADVSDCSPVVVRRVNPPSSQSTPHAVTPSPRHIVSAPTSQHTTPAHPSTSDHAPPAAGKNSQVGLGGDVRSFSWDNLATGETAESEGELYDGCCISCAAIIILQGGCPYLHTC